MREYDLDKFRDVVRFLYTSYLEEIIMFEFRIFEVL